MSTNAREFGLFIDGLRLDRNMSREDLCDGIISLSQYKRYLRGDTSIPNDILVQIADRLNYSISDLHLLFLKKSDSQLEQINNIFNLIKQRKFDDAYKLAKDIREAIFVSKYNKLFFDFCMLFIQHNLNMVSDVHVLELYSKMINYPECQNNESFNIIELNILFQMILISSKIDNYEPAELMYKMLTESQYNLPLGQDTTLLPSIYLVLGQILGRQQKFKRTIEITNQGIEFCLNNEISFALSSLFLINAYAKWDTEDKIGAIESAKKALLQLYIEGKSKKLDDYKKSIENKFNMNFEDVIDL
ncbi:helix-turn-helix domain-containing protein [Candidatus Xianfuyuplasma coldseepsis]|uniref:Helix-turn-helix transcriptional regulator n=1 Tax=Candidatus Xianfuyuplasma coldseepsis TaxID=2782163 RepID=A0A7L7KUD0_9MOLU|nr:helix-turn-helix transcriptional regulator [Xianfuyuplasma coldseepsis]QMS85604.1 helix-turn-helix transcriptional regulator [Xianfuyuplasma coldseepsis]